VTDSKRQVRRRWIGRLLSVTAAIGVAGLLAQLILAPPATAARRSPLGPRVPVLHWRACDHGFQCATARVPLDYRHPRGKLISIAVIRHRAEHPARRVGTLFVNGGGPAEQILGFIAEYPDIPAVLRQRFDIISFDPRGFGFSTPVRCFSSIAAENKELAPVLPYPIFPVGSRQITTFERTYARFDAQCIRHAGPLLYHDSTADVARDMNLLREAVGARRLNYVGLSYGTGLGAIYANLFPSTVGHMVLDGNLDPVSWTRGGRVPAFVRLGNGPNEAAQNRAFLSLCGRLAATVCAFSAGSPAATRAKFATLLKRLQAHPVKVDGQEVTYADVFMIVPPGDVSEWQPAAVQLQQLWTATTDSLRSPASGFGADTSGQAGLQSGATASTATPYLGLEQSFAVLCADTGDPRNARDYVAAARAGARYGGFGELAAWEDEMCAHWPRRAGQDRYDGPWDRRTADTILVIGNTGDPATAYHNSVAMARDLGRARLLTVDGFGHTEFYNPSICASNYEFRYLITGALPPRGTSCPQTVQPFPTTGS
jgi:pimeloyl-ACP methyl ester carboxylesterase